MNLARHIPHSIGLTQAVIVLLASFVIGLTLSLSYLSLNLADQREEARTLAQDIITATEGAATNAVWNLDEALAQEVINSVMALGVVSKAYILNEDGDYIAQATKAEQNYNQFIRWFSERFIADQVKATRELKFQLGDRDFDVGSIVVELSAEKITSKFFALSITILVAALVQALTIALVLVWLSTRLVTRPLQRAAIAITDVDPDHPEVTKIPIPERHKKNELGHLLFHANTMLDRLATSQRQLRKLATMDPLTNQPNRTQITERLTEALITANQKNRQVGVLFLDVDRFKHINDSLGHEVGDDLLIEAARRLESTLRHCDAMGRLGGDEFLIVVEHISELEEIVSVVQRVIEALSEPMLLQGHDIRTSASIGIAVYPKDGKDSDTLMRCADIAMYVAKTSTNAWEFFSEEMSRRVDSRLSTEAALRYALEHEKFSLQYQPKLVCPNQSLAGCEALLRMETSERSISAGEFIEIAEDNGSIVDIGIWVLEEACRQLRDWNKRLHCIPIAINVSARQLQEPDFVERALGVIDRYEIPKYLIEFEITETILLNSWETNLAKLDRLRKAGITISIDDFGTGYSSLSYLTRLPVDILKIDRSFVSGPQTSPAILSMIINMAKTLNLQTVAEGVETQEQKDWLIKAGCNYLQGYFISKPIYAEDFEEKF